MSISTVSKKSVQVTVARATVRFAGDSGDGMQLVGSQFADIASLVGNQICTLPDFPSEIRAPVGTLAGVSAYQLHFGEAAVTTPGDAPFVLVAMNPAALQVHLPELEPGGIVVVNEDEFTAGNLEKAGYPSNPLEDGSLDAYRVIAVPMSRLNESAVEASGLPRSERARCKNFFALGMMLWLYERPLQPVLEWLMKKFGKNRQVLMANGASVRAGYHFADTAELFPVHFQVPKASLAPGWYRRVTGNEALAMGCLVAAERAGRTLVYASYPITPASEILHELSKHHEYGVRVIQAEDEIAACCAAIGASFAGASACGTCCRQRISSRRRSPRSTRRRSFFWTATAVRWARGRSPWRARSPPAVRCSPARFKTCSNWQTSVRKLNRRHAPRKSTSVRWCRRQRTASRPRRRRAGLR